MTNGEYPAFPSGQYIDEKGNVRSSIDGMTETEFINGVNGSELKLIKEQLLDMRLLIENIKTLSMHNIPFYAFGDNEAACEMNNRLNEIYNLVNKT